MGDAEKFLLDTPRMQIAAAIDLLNNAAAALAASTDQALVAAAPLFMGGVKAVGDALESLVDVLATIAERIPVAPLDGP